MNDMISKYQLESFLKGIRKQHHPFGECMIDEIMKIVDHWYDDEVERRMKENEKWQLNCMN